MSPTPFHDHQQPKRETNELYTSHLKINKDSHFIKKTSPPSSSSSSSSSLINGISTVTQAKPQQRHPVIIYTHSPKIIHTHPRDFMALVQKLTGLSRSDNDHQHKIKSEPANNNRTSEEDDKNHKGGIISDDNDSTSVVTDENGGSVGDAQVNSCFVSPPIFDPPNPCFNNIPIFAPNPADFLCSTPPFYNYTDSMFFVPNMRSSISSSTLEGLKEFPEY